MPDWARSLGAHDRLAAVGIAVVAVSLLLPWWGITAAGGLVKTPVGSLSFVEVAIVLTLSAAAYLIARAARDRPLPYPLHLGTLIAVAGAWTAILTGYRIFDRPDFPLSERVALRYGIFIALGGAALIITGGLRRRRDELTADRARERPEAGAKAGE